MGLVHKTLQWICILRWHLKYTRLVQTKRRDLELGVSKIPNPKDPIPLSEDEQGVYNHFRNAKYLSSTKPFSEGEPGSLGQPEYGARGYNFYSR